MNTENFITKIEEIDDLLSRAVSECKYSQDKRTQKIINVAKIYLSELLYLLDKEDVNENKN